MLTAAAREFGIDLSKSFVVGDRFVDVKTGENAGCKTVLVLTGYGETEKQECLANARVDHIAEDAYSAWKFIKRVVTRQENHASKNRKRMKGVLR